MVKRVVFDIEADGLLDTITKVHCICCLDVDTGVENSFTPDTLHLFQDYLDSTDVIIGHNIVSYDIPALKRILNITFAQKIIDTLLLSKLLNPDRGGHALDDWGERLGNPKIHFDEWELFTQEMLDYCVQDVRLNLDVYKELVKEAKGWDWSQSYTRELRVAEIIYRQEEHGVLFDRELAEICVPELDEMLRDLEGIVEPQLPMRRIPESSMKVPPKKRFVKLGGPSALAYKYFGERLHSKVDSLDGDERWFVDYPDGTEIRLEDATTPLLTHEPMKMGNQASLKEWLQTEGWRPTFWNMRKDKETGKKKRTSPKFTDQNKTICPNLIRLGEKVEFIKHVVLWLSYRNRRNVIRSDNGTGWLNNPRLAKDNRLSASADTIGTNTGRFAHRVVANVPRTTSVYGRQMRSLFTVDPDYYMVGWDASGLESRIEGHYTYKYDGGEYAGELLDGDIHSKNALVFNCDRETAKTVKYAVTYGAQGPRIASSLGVPTKRGDEIYSKFWESSVALKMLRDNLFKYWKSHSRAYVLGLDGRKVMTRSEHSLINTLFQSGGIICMKEAMVLWDEWVTEEDLDASQVIHYHDEAQAEVHRSLVEFKQFDSKEDAEEWTDTKIWSDIIVNDKGVFRAYSRPGELGVLSIREAGKKLGLNVMLDAEYKVGMTWADTH